VAGPDTGFLVAEMVGVLNETENYGHVPVGERAYLDRRARLPHQLVTALGDESSRYLAQDAEDRASRAREVADADALRQTLPSGPLIGRLPLGQVAGSGAGRSRALGLPGEDHRMGVRTREGRWRPRRRLP
jgi:hypothetical protein